MTGGGDLDEIDDIGTEDDETPLAARDEALDGDGSDGLTNEMKLNVNDTDPTAGGSDIGGRAGGDVDDADPDL